MFIYCRTSLSLSMGCDQLSTKLVWYRCNGRFYLCSLRLLPLSDALELIWWPDSGNGLLHQLLPDDQVAVFWGFHWESSSIANHNWPAIEEVTRWCELCFVCNLFLFFFLFNSISSVICIQLIIFWNFLHLVGNSLAIYFQLFLCNHSILIVSFVASLFINCYCMRKKSSFCQLTDGQQLLTWHIAARYFSVIWVMKYRWQEA